MSSERNVLIVTPHFPPDSSAASHRMRLLAPHLSEFQWTPTVVTLAPESYEARLDEALLEMVPSSLDVVRVPAWSPRWTRRFGVGDLGLRAFHGLYEGCRRLIETKRFDCLLVTIYPSYPALLGPLMKRRFDLPFVLDYQDPWISEWGKTAGPGPGGAPDLKSRLSRTFAMRLEPRAVAAADAITAVSEGTYVDVRRRYELAADTPCTAIPLGGERADFEHLEAHPRTNPHFDAHDGAFHLCYVGTLLPKGYETLRAFLRALALVRARDPDQADRIRVHFFGTSNQTTGDDRFRVLPIAEELGVTEHVSETPARIDYLDALTVLTESSAILLMGSSERHYTASKLYPALLARRPLLAAYHQESSVVSIVTRAAPAPLCRLVTYDDAHPVETRVEALASALSALVADEDYDDTLLNLDAVDAFSARAMASRLAKVLDGVVAA